MSNTKGTFWSDILKLLTVLLPFAISFMIYVSELNTRITVLENVSPTKLDVQEAVKIGIKEGMGEIAREIKQNHIDITNVRMDIVKLQSKLQADSNK
jgi:hypothetical protein